MNGATIDFASNASLPDRLELVTHSNRPRHARSDATVYLTTGGVRGFPIAAGYCGSGGFPTAQPNVVTLGTLSDALLVEAANARQPCHLITPTGAISRFKTRLQRNATGHSRVFEPLDDVVWTMPRFSPETSAPAIPRMPGELIRVAAIFHGGDGSDNPTGLSTGYIDEARGYAVGSMNFNALGRGVSPDRGPAMAICAIRLQRR